MRIRGRKPSADCCFHLTLLSSSSTTAANSPAFSRNSSSISSISTPSPRCRGLDLLVKAIHQVSDGSVVGVPYIQRRVTIRRRRRRSSALQFAAFLFDELSQTRSERIAEKFHNYGNKHQVEKKKQKLKKGKKIVIGLPVPIFEFTREA